MQGCWDNDIVVQKKLKRERSDVMDLKSSFMDCFQDKKATQSNLENFLDEQTKLLRKNITNRELVKQFKALVIETSNDQELSECLDMAMEGFMDRFMEKKPKTQEAHFFPSKDSEERLINFIYNAKKTLDICVFSITNNNIANAIYLAHRDGVKVRIITDDDCMEQKGSDVVDLAKAGIPCRSDGNHQAHMHHKFCLRDGKYLLNGSFNWTVQAVNANQENIMIIENKELVKQYVNQFQKMWDQFKNSSVEVEQHTPKRFARLR